MTDSDLIVLAPAQPAHLEWRAAGGPMSRASGRLVRAWDDHVVVRLAAGFGRPANGQRLWLRVETRRGLASALAMTPPQIAPAGQVRVELTSEMRLLQRRQHQRARIDRPLVRATVLDHAGQPGRTIYVHLADLSAGGARLATGEALPPGARLRLEVIPDRAAPVQPEMTVLARAPLPGRPVGNVGLTAAGRRPVEVYRLRGRFVGLTDAERQRIAGYVERRRSLPWRRSVGPTAVG